MSAPIVVRLPVLHRGQIAAFRKLQEHRFLALRAGRRWGKTDFGKTIAADRATKGKMVGWFAPDYKRLSEAFHEISQMLAPVISQSSKVDGVIRTITGGRIDFWTLEDESAGRSRKYHIALIDEAAFTKPQMMDIWERSIMPTLLDYTGKAVAMSNTNGINPENFFWRICNQEEHGFAQYHAPSEQNPYMPAAELERLRNTIPPLVFQQEYLAEFVDWSGDEFFDREKLLVDGRPVPFPMACDTVFAIIDSASKTGIDHDGTAVVYFALCTQTQGYPLTVLDWEITQIEGAFLDEWLPSVRQNLTALSEECGAIYGTSGGIWVEDKNSGTILLQQASRHGWDDVSPIESKLTSLGKDERAINASPAVYQGRVKISERAFNKRTRFKGVEQNHLMTQIKTFRVGDKAAAKRADDLLDDFTYGVEIGLGVRGQAGDVF